MDYVSASVLLMALVASIVPATAQLSKASVLCDNGPCGFGYYFDKMKMSCVLCPPGTYQSNLAHKCTACIACSTPSDLQEVVEDCTGKTDTVVTCIVGYYDAGNTGNQNCQKCGTCEDDEIVVRPCGRRSDTKCSKTSTPLDNEGKSLDEHTSEVDKSGSESWTTGSSHSVIILSIISVTGYIISFMLR